MYLISDGVPPSRDEWPKEVLEACTQFAAGDVVANPPFFYFADAAYPVWEATRAQDPTDGVIIVDASAASPPFGVITSQTCDIGEEASRKPARPWITVAPVFDFSGADQNLRAGILNGRGTATLVHLPALEAVSAGLWAADLRIEFPVEKGFLVGKTPIAGFDDEIGARRLLTRVAELRQRPAWAQSVLDSVGESFYASLQTLRKSNRALYDEVSETVDGVGVQANSMFKPATIRIGVFLASTLSTDAEAWLDSVVETAEEAGRSLGLDVQQSLTVQLSDCSVLEHRKFVPIPLSRFSSVD